MGMGMADLLYLSEKGYLAGPDCRILDIGSQNLYNAAPSAIRRFVERHGRIDDEEAFEKEAERLSYLSTPRPGERTAYISELLDLTDIYYTSYDVCPALKTEIFDLNCERLPPHYRDSFDVVLNFGTSEHIINQLNSFWVMHDAMKVRAVAFHQLPSIGWIGHGYFTYHGTFFDDLVRVNGYTLVDRWYTLVGKARLDEVDLRDAQYPLVAGTGQAAPAAIEVPSYNLNVVLQKTEDRPFAVGLELATTHAQPDASITDRYGGAAGGLAVSGDGDSVRSDRPEVPFGLDVMPARALAAELLRRIRKKAGF